MKKPVVDIGDCVLCGICVELAPHVFAINDSGFVDVMIVDDYSDQEIHEAIKNCPKDCITRE